LYGKEKLWVCLQNCHSLINDIEKINWNIKIR
jgi:hypothetical protein